MMSLNRDIYLSCADPAVQQAWLDDFLLSILYIVPLNILSWQLQPFNISGSYSISANTFDSPWNLSYFLEI